MAEDIWQFLPYPTPHKSVFEAGWIDLKPEWIKPELGSNWHKLREIRQAVNLQLESKRGSKEIGASLEAKVAITVDNEPLKQLLLSLNPSASDIAQGVDELRYLFLASQVEIREVVEKPENSPLASIPEFIVTVEKADGHKCDRCWNYSTSVGLSPKHPLLCDRCETVIEEGAVSGQLVQSEDGSWQPV
jgi:isoleucyl-tRNA synthetase